MKIGTNAICRGSRDYAFTQGKAYEILDYQPQEMAGNGFTWPTYVKVIDDEGKPAYCHADRFEAVQLEPIA